MPFSNESSVYTQSMTNIFIWIISLSSIAGVILRPFKIKEAVWAVAGAILLLIFGLILPADAGTGVAKGTDVYLFLTGMMLLSETAREVKLFDWLAAHAAKAARGSSGRLFALIYVVGVIVTAFLSNDATAVVLTPAVAAAVKTAKVKDPLPYLLICAFIANAASFLLPISNPANLVIYDGNMPSLWLWLQQFILPSVFAIITTYFVLRFTQRKELKNRVEHNIDIPKLSSHGRIALFGIVATAIILLTCSALGISLGLPTAISGIITSGIVLVSAKKSPWVVIKGISWSILPLVAGLFVIVEAINKTGFTNILTNALHQHTSGSIVATVWSSSIVTAVACNLMNNLPVGLIAGNVIQTGYIPEIIRRAILIAVDLGPNLSVTGSLATILWLVVLRREKVEISAGKFLKLGVLVMTTALALAIVSLWL